MTRHPVVWPVLADEHGDVSLFADPAQLRDRVEAIDVEADEYVFWDAVGRRLVPVVSDGVVSVRAAADTAPRPTELIRVLAGHQLAVPGAVPPELDPAETAEDYLARCVRAVEEVERRFPRRGWWRRRRARDVPPPAAAGREVRTPESWPAWWGEAGFVTPGQLDEVVVAALAGLPPGAVDVVRERGLLRLRPRAVGATGVEILHGAWGLDVFLHPELPGIEISAPVNMNYGPPTRPWDADLADVLTAAAAGRVEVTGTAEGRPVSVDVLGSRLGAQLGRRRGPVRGRTAPWR